MKRYFYKQNQFQTTKFIFLHLLTHYNHQFQHVLTTIRNRKISTTTVIITLLISNLPTLKFNNLGC